MSQSEQVDQIYTALAAAQKTIKNPITDAKNPHFKSKYTTLAAITDSIRVALSAQGIAAFHTTEIMRFDGVEAEYLTTTFGHTSGQWISSTRRIPSGLKVQEYGAWLTYNRRYAISSMAGVAAEEDDDGNSIANKSDNGKRENPNINRAADFAEHEVKYDENGNPVDNIPHGNPDLKPLRVVDARKEYTNLQSELIAMGTVAALRKWANTPQTKDRVQTLPTEWQAHMRDLFEGKKKELSLAEENAPA